MRVVRWLGLLVFFALQVNGCDPGSYYDGTNCQPCPLDPPGYYCGDSTIQICLEGNYCPTPAQQIICPTGYRCPAGTQKPISCGPLKHLECASPGLAKPRSIYLGLIIFGGVIVLWLMALCYLNVSKYCELRNFEDLQKALQNVGKRRASIDALKLNIPRKIEIRFDGIGYEIPGRKVLSNINGIFRPGELTAVMGPSGCGKSSLLNVLSGRSRNGLITGSIYVNGEKVDSLHTYRQVIGFVPQDDVMYSDLTVDDNILYSRLLFSAEAMHGRKQNKDTAWDITYAVINTLSLAKIHTKQVGDVERRGISGGERKRVSVGMEVVRTPAVLLLDEPTSGLDSSTAVQLVSTLQELSKAGMAIVSVVHQPRYEIFTKFDRLILLNGNGRMVYSGPASSAEEYFLTLGFPLPPRVNLADHIMDVMMGLRKVPRGRKVDEEKEAEVLKDDQFRLEGEISEADKKAINHYLTSKWKEQQTVNDQFWKTNNNRHVLAKRDEIEALYTPEDNHWNQFVYVTERQLVQLLRAYRTFFLDNLLGFVVGVIIAALFGDMNINGNLAAELQAIQLALALPATVVGLRIFGMDRDIYARECFNGMNATAYFFGKFWGTIPHLLLPPLVFLAGFYALMRPRGTIGDYYCVFLLTQWAVIGMSCLISIWFQKKNSSFVALILVLLFLISNGLSPRTEVLEHNLGWFGTFLSGISYLRWTAEGLALAEFRSYPPVLFDDQVKGFLQPSGWSIDDWAKVNTGLVVHGIVTRIVCWVWLCWGSKITGFALLIPVYFRHIFSMNDDSSSSQSSLPYQTSNRRRGSDQVPLATNGDVDHSDFYTDTRRSSVSDRRSSADYSQLHGSANAQIYENKHKVPAHQLYDNYSPQHSTTHPPPVNPSIAPSSRPSQSQQSESGSGSADNSQHAGSVNTSEQRPRASSAERAPYFLQRSPQDEKNDGRGQRNLQDIEMKSVPYTQIPSNSTPSTPSRTDTSRHSPSHQIRIIEPHSTSSSSSSSSSSSYYQQPLSSSSYYQPDAQPQMQQQQPQTYYYPSASAPQYSPGMITPHTTSSSSTYLTPSSSTTSSSSPQYYQPNRSIMYSAPLRSSAPTTPTLQHPNVTEDLGTGRSGGDVPGSITHSKSRDDTASSRGEGVPVEGELSPTFVHEIEGQDSEENRN